MRKGEYDEDIDEETAILYLVLAGLVFLILLVGYLLGYWNIK